jgi:transposase-like protein
MVVMNSLNQMIISSLYTAKEGTDQSSRWFSDLKDQGLNPFCVTMDGERQTMHMTRIIWPGITIQRCLYHIQREALRWLRSKPKTKAGQELRRLLSSLCSIRSVRERGLFLQDYRIWLKKYKNYVYSLPMHIKANFDLKRTISLIDNAIPDMFHYLMDSNIPATSNMLEGFYSRLKLAYKCHRGLSQRHKIQFLKWYCYFENQQKTNNS